MSVEELLKRLRGVDHMSVEDCFLQSPLFGHAADKLEELATQLLALRKWRQEYVGKLTIAEAALAEKDQEIAALREERDFLQEILDARPAINAALPESYIRWSRSIYSGEAVRASLSARNEGGNDDND